METNADEVFNNLSMSFININMWISQGTVDVLQVEEKQEDLDLDSIDP